MRRLHAVGNAPALRGGGASTDLDTSNLPCELAKGRREELMHYEITLWARTMPAEDESTSRVPGSLVQGFRPSLLHHRIWKTATNVKSGCDGHGFACHISPTHTKNLRAGPWCSVASNGSCMRDNRHVLEHHACAAPCFHDVPMRGHFECLPLTTFNFVKLH